MWTLAVVPDIKVVEQRLASSTHVFHRRRLSSSTCIRADSAEALARLGRHYQLVIVSNVHRDGFAACNQQLGCQFAAVITAEDVGAYKPAANHFRELERLLGDLGAERAELCMLRRAYVTTTCRRSGSDCGQYGSNPRHHRPGWGATPKPSEESSYDAEFSSMAAFAESVDEQFG